MQIARIITSMPELSGGLVRDLNSRGFEVHIITPEQAISGTADLEIRLETISRPIAGEVRASAIPPLTATAMPEAAALQTAVQQPAAQQPAVHQDDIWTMLAAFDGDAATQDVVAVHANLAGIASQEATATTTLASNENSPERSDTAGNELFVNEAVAVQPIDPEPILSAYNVDPELVPSMFNFSASGESAPAEQETASSSNRSPWRGSELRKTNLHYWNSPLPKVAAAAAGCAAFVILMFLTFAHSHALPKTANSPAQETRTTKPFHGAQPSARSDAETAAQPAAPIKPAVLVSTVSSPSRATPHAAETDTAVAEDTIVRYGSSAKKTPEVSATKPSAIRYYSDMD